MAINPALLISSPTLQDYLVDKSTGAPLSAGIVTCYEDSSRTTLKNWYYQTGTVDNYSYVTLPNPMTLSAVGTIADVNGNDTIPFFYAYSEDDNETPQPYFITVYNSNGQFQFSRQNFPYVASTTPSTISVPTLKNLIVNNQFWRNMGDINGAVDLSNQTNIVLAPSQHDGLTNPDFRFIKSMTGATETCTFTPFISGSPPLIGDITPEVYINHNCTAAEGGETLKVYQFPIALHIETLESVEFSVTIQAQNASGNNTLTLYLYQFLGTGVTSPSQIVIGQPIELSDTWQKYVITGTFPSAADKVLSLAGDDALYFQIGLPLTVICDINFTLPSIYLSAKVPTNNFTTYDDVNSIVSSPRTGDYRFSLNSFQSFGWVAADDGTIGNNSNSTWQLYNLLWNNVLDHWAPVVGGRGVSAYADFTDGKFIALTRNLGRVVAGLNPIFNMPVNFTVNTSTSVITLASAVPITAVTVGTPLTMYNTGGGLPNPFGANGIYFVTGTPTTTTFQLATTIENAVAQVPITITTTGTGTQTITNALGVYAGETFHQLTVPEMPSHQHTPDIGGSFITNVSSAGVSGTAGPNFQTTPHTSSVGGNVPHYNVQPTVFVNAFFKL